MLINGTDIADIICEGRNIMKQVTLYFIILLAICLFVPKAWAFHTLNIPIYNPTAEIPYQHVEEKAYAVSSHVILTRGHPYYRDGLIGKEQYAWFYMVNMQEGIKAYLVEYPVPVDDYVPAALQEWYRDVKEQIDLDGGALTIVISFKNNDGR